MTTVKSVTGQSLDTRTIAAHGLSGSMLDPPRHSLDPERFSRLLSVVRTQRLTGLLWKSIVDDSLPVTPEQAEQAEAVHVEALAATLVLEELLLETVERLESQDVPVRVLKGAAVAHLDYPDPSMRTFGDIDLLIQGEFFDRAVKCLLAQGHTRQFPEPRPGFDRRFNKGTSFRTAGGLEIDVHRTFTMGPFGVRLDLPRLWESQSYFALCGRRLAALSREERFLHACYHAALGEIRPRLSPLRDAAQILLGPPLDLERLHALIRASGGEAVVSRAVLHAWSEFQLADVLAVSAWAHAHRTSPREAADLSVYGGGSSYTTKSLAALRALPTMTQRLSFLYALLVPRRAYLEHRHRGRITRLRTGLSERNRARRPQ